MTAAELDPSSVRVGRRPARRLPRPARLPRPLRLWLEGAGVFALGIVAAVWQVPALQTGSNAIYDDLMVQAMGPDRHGLARLLKDGIFPAWQRSQFTGEPYAANTQHEALYPGSLPFLITKTSTAMDVVIGLHIALAVLGMWLYLRLALRSGALAAVFGGLAWGLSSQILGHITLGDQLHVLVWTPWVFLGTHLALERGRLRHVVLLSVAIGLQFLAGHPEEWVYSIAASGLYAAVWVLGAGPGREIPRRLLHGAIRYGGGLVGFVLLFGWALLPALLLKGQGFRNGTFNENHPLPVQQAFTTLLPDYGTASGNPARLIGEDGGYAGIVALALFALYLAAGRGRVWLRAYFALALAFGLTMALGNRSHHPQLYNLFYDHISLIHQFRVPSRWLLLVCFALCAGGALGLDTLLERVTLRSRAMRAGLTAVAVAGVLAFCLLMGGFAHDGRNTHWWVVIAAVTAAVYALAQVRQLPRFLLALVLIVASVTELHDAKPKAEYRQTAPNALYDDYGPIARLVAASGGRYVSIAGNAVGSQKSTIAVPAGVTAQRARDYYAQGEQGKLDLRPNNSVAVGAQALNGRDNGLEPTGRYKDFFDNATGLGGNIGASYLPGSSPLPDGTTLPEVIRQWRWPALDLQALDWVVTNVAIVPAEQQVLADHGFTPALTEAYVQLWHRAPQPLFRVFHDLQAAPTRQDRLDLMQTPDGYPWLTRAFTETPVAVDPAPATPEVPAPAQVDASGSRVSTTVTMGSRGLLLLSDPYYPQWHVTVDGKAATSYAVDSAFKGVVLDKGQHTVVWTYVDRRLQLGLGLGGLTLVGLAVAGAVPRVRRRRRGEPVPDATGSVGSDV